MDRTIAKIYKILGVVICGALLTGATYILTKWSPLLILVVFLFFMAASLAGTGYAMNAIWETRKYRAAGRKTKKMKKDLWGELVFCWSLSFAFFAFSIILVGTLLIMVISGNAEKSPEQIVGDNAIYAPGVER